MERNLGGLRGGGAGARQRLMALGLWVGLNADLARFNWNLRREPRPMVVPALVLSAVQSSCEEHASSFCNDRTKLSLSHPGTFEKASMKE